MCTECALNVHWMFTECPLNVHWMSTECSLNVHWMFTERSLNVHWMFSECSLNVHWMFTERSLNVYWIFTESSLNLHWIFTECSRNVHWMFTECSLNVHWLLPEIELQECERSRRLHSVGRRRKPPQLRNPSPETSGKLQSASRNRYSLNPPAAYLPHTYALLWLLLRIPSACQNRCCELHCFWNVLVSGMYHALLCLLSHTTPRMYPPSPWAEGR